MYLRVVTEAAQYFVFVFPALMVVYTMPTRHIPMFPRSCLLFSQVGPYLGCAERVFVSWVQRSEEGGDGHRLAQDGNATVSPGSMFPSLLWRLVVVHVGIVGAPPPPQRNLMHSCHPPA